MKKIILALFAIIAFALQAEAQKKVNYSKIKGEWELIIDVQKEIEEEKEDMDFLERAVASLAGEIVEEVMEHIDIRFEFHKNGTYTLKVHTDDEDEFEEGEWYIDEGGALVIDDVDGGDLNIEGDNRWFFDKGNLIPLEDGKLKKSVYMRRVN